MNVKTWIPLGLALVLGLIAAICIASANYVINEWFDRESDKFHPEKSRRAAVRTQLNGTIIFLEWAGLVSVGLSCALASSSIMFLVVAVFALQGLIYNVPPLRSKDKAYLDVISESINNPLRLMIGWAMVDPTTLPPGSIILMYWAGGAFLMAAKRLSEYREITRAISCADEPSGTCASTAYSGSGIMASRKPPHTMAAYADQNPKPSSISRSRSGNVSARAMKAGPPKQFERHPSSNDEPSGPATRSWAPGVR